MMVYIRSKTKGGRKYYYIVEGKLDERGKVKQKVILYLGSIDKIIAVYDFFKKHCKKEDPI